jgi:HEAT repeat protein
MAIGVLFLAALVSSGCDAPGGTLYQRLQHEDPSVRIQAMCQAARQNDTEALPYLVDRLNDDEADVRFFAIVALEKMTGQRMGYEHYAPALERAEAVERWRQWLRRRGQSATQPADRPS